MSNRAKMRVALKFNLKDNFSDKRGFFYKDSGCKRSLKSHTLDGRSSLPINQKERKEQGNKKNKIINRALQNQNSPGGSRGG